MYLQIPLKFGHLVHQQAHLPPHCHLVQKPIARPSPSRSCQVFTGRLQYGKGVWLILTPTLTDYKEQKLWLRKRLKWVIT